MCNNHMYVYREVSQSILLDLCYFGVIVTRLYRGSRTTIMVRGHFLDLEGPLSWLRSWSRSLYFLPSSGRPSHSLIPSLKIFGC